jgi:hypothetical protein
MKTLVLAACLWVSPVLAQEIVIQGHFPPKDAGSIEIVVPEGWKQDRVDKVAGSERPMEGVTLRYKDGHGKEHSVWIIFSVEETD